MAYVISHFFPGGTRAQYGAAMIALNGRLGAIPKGQTLHVAGPVPGDVGGRSGMAVLGQVGGSGVDAGSQAEPVGHHEVELGRLPRPDRDVGLALGEDSKQVTLTAMLRVPDGATIEEIATATVWQSHTLRGALARALTKKLGLDLTSEKVEGRGRVYGFRLPDALSPPGKVSIDFCGKRHFY